MSIITFPYNVIDFRNDRLILHYYISNISRNVSIIVKSKCQVVFPVDIKRFFYFFIRIAIQSPSNIWSHNISKMPLNMIFSNVLQIWISITT